MTSPPDLNAKDASSLITAEMRENARRNVEQYPWAAEIRDELKRSLRPWLELSYDELWSLVPAPEIGRDSAVNRDAIGCPRQYMDGTHGDQARVFRVDLLNRPWQVQNTQTGEWFPKNDFASFYQSALDERGRFDPERGDPAFLQPGDDVEGPAREWIEDGTGVEFQDRKWFFVGFYAYHMWWKLPEVAHDMALLYTLTGNPEYARRAAILLDRIADFYPHMYERESRALGMSTSYDAGRVMGRGWENSRIQTPLSLTYDYIYDALIEDQELAEFLQRKAEQTRTGDKSSPEAVAAHIQRNLLGEFLRAIRSNHTYNPRSTGQMALAAVATALDHPRLTPENLDWLFSEEGGQLPALMVNKLSRDGTNDERGGYAFITGRESFRIANILRRYQAYDRHDLFRDYPNFRATFSMTDRLRVLDRAHLGIGDGGGSIALNSGWTLPLEMLVEGYRVYGDPAIRREMIRQAGEEPGAFIWEVYREDPINPYEATENGGEPFESRILSGYGLGLLQAASREHPRAAAIYYGTMGQHAHADRLTLHLRAHDTVLAPDMGYPLFTGRWPARIGFTSHVVSHNTVMVDDRAMEGRGRNSPSGRVVAFAEEGPLRLLDIDGDAAQVYGEQMETYRRMLVQIDLSEEDSYVLDLFWVRGGNSHRLTQNGLGKEVVLSEGMERVAQEKGTLAGPDVEFGEFYDGPANWDYRGSGFQFLKRVERAASPESPFWMDWEIMDLHQLFEPDRPVHFRVHNLGSVDELILADGVPPQRPANPETIRYTQRLRQGENLHSQFVSVLEPYAGQPLLTSVRLLKEGEDENGFFAALEVKGKDSLRDLLLVRENPGTLSAEGVEMEGRLAMVRFDGDRVIESVLVNGTRLRIEGVEEELPAAPPISGVIVGVEEGEELIFKTDGAAQVSAGDWILIESEEEADATYQVREVRGRDLLMGPTSAVLRFKDPEDYTDGMVPLVREGNRFFITNSISSRFD